MREVALADPPGLLVHPDTSAGVGVLVLAGSSGRIDEGRVRLLAAHGAVASSLRWFRDDGPSEVPLRRRRLAEHPLRRRHPPGQA